MWIWLENGKSQKLLREKEEEAVDRADERDMIPTEFSEELLQQDREINLKSFSKSFQSLRCGGNYTQM